MMWESVLIFEQSSVWKRTKVFTLKNGWPGRNVSLKRNRIDDVVKL